MPGTFSPPLLISDPDIHHGTCVTHVPWCMPGLQTSGGGENVPYIPGACGTRNFAYLVRGPWRRSGTVLLCFVLFHCGLVTPCDFVDMDHHWTWWWFAACSAPNHYLNHYWHIVNWIRRNRRFWSKYNDFHSRICTCKGRLLNVGHFVHASLWYVALCVIVPVLPQDYPVSSIDPSREPTRLMQTREQIRTPDSKPATPAAQPSPTKAPKFKPSAKPTAEESPELKDLQEKYEQL